MHNDYIPDPTDEPPLSESQLPGLYNKLLRLRRWKQALKKLPDREIVIGKALPLQGFSGVFTYKLTALDYRRLADLWFKDRNKTFKRNFVEYLTQFFAILIEAELLPDGTLTKQEDGVEVFALDLKKINRNYADLNQVLFKHGLLELISPHQEGEKCRTYRVPREILVKGVKLDFLTTEQKTELIETIRVSTQPDKTIATPDPLLGYYLDQLKRTKIPPQDFEGLQIEIGLFRRLYPKVVRHFAGKYDLTIIPSVGRLSSVYLEAPRVFRSLLKWDGMHLMVEGDVAASHFHFLLQEMTDPNEREQMRKDLLSADPYLAMCGVSDVSLRADLKQSSHLFKYGNRTINRYFIYFKKTKVVPYTHGLFYKHLSQKYPKFAYAMATKEISHKKHRREFACDVMKKESAVMVQMVGKRCMSEKLVYLPIHDGFLTLPEQYDRVCQIITESFQQSVGSVPVIRRKG